MKDDVTTARVFASDLYQLLTRGLIEVEPVDDASPRIRPTAAGAAVISEPDDVEPCHPSCRCMRCCP
jgi:hypothetical protein